MCADTSFDEGLIQLPLVCTVIVDSHEECLLVFLTKFVSWISRKISVKAMVLILDSFVVADEIIVDVGVEPPSSS
jgi:hypothetical protein